MGRRIVVRVQFSRDRAREAEKELGQLVGCGPYCQGTAPERLWDFEDLERAQRFKANAENTPGVQRIEIDD